PGRARHRAARLLRAPGRARGARRPARRRAGGRVSPAGRVQTLVIGSGAGGAVTALELARAGREVLVHEEGERHDLDHYGGTPTAAMERLYRRRGMTPILGRVPIGYVEGCAVGGSTEINSGFWHRAPRDILLRWKAHYDLCDAAESDLAPHYAWAEQMLGVTRSQRPWPASTKVFARGIE